MVRRSFPFLVSTLVLAGCGGSPGGAPEGSAEPVPLPATLGAASMDLAIQGNSGIGTDGLYGTSMIGTGDVPGSVEILNSGPVETGTFVVSALLTPQPAQRGQALSQALSLDLTRTSAVEVGSKFDLAEGANRGTYQESVTWVFDPIAGDGYTRRWTAQSGTVEVTALSDTGLTLRLANVVLRTEGTPAAQIVVSGTLSGAVTRPH